MASLLSLLLYFTHDLTVLSVLSPAAPFILRVVSPYMIQMLKRERKERMKENPNWLLNSQAKTRMGPSAVQTADRAC